MIQFKREQSTDTMLTKEEYKKRRQKEARILLQLEKLNTK
jgi:hypothetical protein